MFSKKHWTLKTYTNAAWTDLVAEQGVIAAILVCNTGATGITVQARLTDGAGVETAVILPPTTVAGNTTQTLVDSVMSTNLAERLDDVPNLSKLSLIHI